MPEIPKHTLLFVIINKFQSIQWPFSIPETLCTPKTKRTNFRGSTSLTFYLLDHFLQPKDKNTQHKLKISHLIVYSFSSLIIISYFQSDIHTHLEAMELGSSSTRQTWLEKMYPKSLTSPTNQLPHCCTVRTGSGGHKEICFWNTMNVFFYYYSWRKWHGGNSETLPALYTLN